MYSLQAAFRYLRRHPGRLAAYSAVSAGAAAAAWYVRKQYVAMTATLDAERTNGARVLRGVYSASRRTVESTLRALLGPGRERIFACEASNPDVLVARLKTVMDPADKKRTWEQLKVAAIVRLVASAYYLVEVYLVLLVQVHLVARYSTPDVDAPIEGLAGGKLELESKQRFLSLARRSLFEQRGIEALVGVVREATEEVVVPVKLSEKVGPDDVRDLLRRICRRVEARCGVGRGAQIRATDCSGDVYSPEREASSGADEAQDGAERHRAVGAQVLNVRRLLCPPREDDVEDGDDWEVWDESVRQLAAEGLDLCEVLDYDRLVSVSADALMDVAGGLVDGYVWGVSGGRVAFASVVARLANISMTALGSGEVEADGAVADVHDAGEGPFVEALLHVPACHAFGASVFLSGERMQG